MKILFASNFRGYWGGVEQMVTTYAKGLSDRGHACYLAYGADSRDADAFAGFFQSTHQCADFGVTDPPEGELFQSILEQVQPDAVFLHKVSHLPEGFEDNTAVRKVYMVHDHDLWCPTKRGNFRISNRICHQKADWRCYLDLAFLERNRGGTLPVKLARIKPKIQQSHRHHKLDAIVPVCTYLEKQLILNGYPKERVHLCFPILNYEVSDPPPVPEEPNILFVGTLINSKGVDYLLRALKLVQCPFTLNIVGQGNYEPYLRKLCTKLGLDDQVNFVGWVDHDVVTEYYRNTKMVTLPSIWPECFALVRQESMRNGRPVVGFDVGGNTDWLKHNHTGLVAPEQDIPAYAKALERLLTDTALARTMGENAARRAQTAYSYDQFMDRVEGILRGDDDIPPIPAEALMNPGADA